MENRQTQETPTYRRSFPREAAPLAAALESIADIFARAEFWIFQVMSFSSFWGREQLQ